MERIISFNSANILISLHSAKQIFYFSMLKSYVCPNMQSLSVQYRVKRKCFFLNAIYCCYLENDWFLRMNSWVGKGVLKHHGAWCEGMNLLCFGEGALTNASKVFVSESDLKMKWSGQKNKIDNDNNGLCPRKLSSSWEFCIFAAKVVDSVC